MKLVFVKKIQIRFNNEFGYFCGMVFGDGWLYHNKKSNNYNITMESGRKKQADNFKHSIQKCFPELNVWESFRRKKRTFEGVGKIYNNRTYLVGTNSLKLYRYLRQFKLLNARWVIPSCFYTNKNVARGFIDGIIESEGSFHKDIRYEMGYSRIHVICKYKLSLWQLKRLLKKTLDIHSIINKRKDGAYVLDINRKKDILKVINHCPRCLSKVKIREVSQCA